MGMFIVFFKQDILVDLTTGVLKSAKHDDERQCKIWSGGFPGIIDTMDNIGTTKVLMVHGITKHLPGYSTILMENLAKLLDLDVMSQEPKDLVVSSEFAKRKNLGNLRLTKLTNRAKTKELLFYELTWSNLTDEEKEVLSYDRSEIYSSQRTQISNVVKSAVNDAFADPMIYLGELQVDILSSVTEAFCWMVTTKWDTFPDESTAMCGKTLTDETIERVKDDNFFFITHSLGSRITIDALQRIATLVDDDEIMERYPMLAKLHKTYQTKEIMVYMLANQLQLLQLGRTLPDIVNKDNQYCKATGDKYDHRFVNSTNIIAFSDPNDILSYGIPYRYKAKYLDSRLCSKINNININVANVISILGLGRIANPVDAHRGYEADIRVLSLIAFGLHDSNKLIKEKCDWILTTDD